MYPSRAFVTHHHHSLPLVSRLEPVLHCENSTARPPPFPRSRPCSHCHPRLSPHPSPQLALLAHLLPALGVDLTFVHHLPTRALRIISCMRAHHAPSHICVTMKCDITRVSPPPPSYPHNA